MRQSFYRLRARTVTRTPGEFSLLAHLQTNCNTNITPYNENAAGQAGPRLYANKHTSPEGESYLFANDTYDIIECRNKEVWADHRTGYCHVCRDPIGGSVGTHMGDRDHTNMQVCVLLSAIYPRNWKAGAVIDSIREEVGWEPPSSNETPTAPSVGAASDTSSATKAGPSRIVSSSANDANKTITGGSASLESDLPPSRAFIADRNFRRRVFGNIFAYATNDNNYDNLHVYDDTARRAELQSLIQHLIDSGTMSRADSLMNKWAAVPSDLLQDMEALMPTEPEDSQHVIPNAVLTAVADAPLVVDTTIGAPVATRRHPHSVLTHSITEPNGSFPFWYSGERMWKKHMIKMMTMMFPPMQAGVLTNFSQKCWGRVNQERLFDALKIQDLRRALNLPLIPENKERKAFFVRAILWELMSAKMRPTIDPVTETLIDLTIRRFCFELIFLQTMLYMNKIQTVMDNLDHIEYDELRRLQLW